MDTPNANEPLPGDAEQELVINEIVESVNASPETTDIVEESSPDDASFDTEIMEEEITEESLPAEDPVEHVNEVIAAETPTGMTLKQKLSAKRTAARLQALEAIQSQFRVGERFLLYFFCAIFVLGAFLLLLNINKLISVDVPASGGTYSEGILGSARFINPTPSSPAAARGSGWD